MAPLRARFTLVAALLVAAPLAACSNQAEGERCDRNNNNDDCQDGLVCKSSAELGGNADICCPEGGSEVDEGVLGLRDGADKVHHSVARLARRTPVPI